MSETTPTPKTKTYTLWLVLITILLLISIGFQIIGQIQRQAKLEGFAELAQQQQVTALKLYTDYREVAYGPNVDRITEQQLVATEYTLQALQLIALQNAQIIEILAIR